MGNRPQLQPRHLLDPVRPEPKAEPVVAVWEKPTEKTSVVTRKWDNKIGSYIDD